MPDGEAGLGILAELSDDSEIEEDSMKRPGFEEWEDCHMHYDPDKADERRCFGCMRNSYGEECFYAWKRIEDAKRQEELDAMTPEERKHLDEMITELRKLY